MSDNIKSVLEQEQAGVQDVPPEGVLPPAALIVSDLSQPRSPSPLFVPGASISYAQILRGSQENIVDLPRSEEIVKLRVHQNQLAKQNVVPEFELGYDPIIPPEYVPRGHLFDFAPDQTYQIPHTPTELPLQQPQVLIKENIEAKPPQELLPLLKNVETKKETQKKTPEEKPKPEQKKDKKKKGKGSVEQKTEEPLGKRSDPVVVAKAVEAEPARAGTPDSGSKNKKKKNKKQGGQEEVITKTELQPEVSVTATPIDVVQKPLEVATVPQAEASKKKRNKKNKNKGGAGGGDASEAPAAPTETLEQASEIKPIEAQLETANSQAPDSLKPETGGKKSKKKNKDKAPATIPVVESAPMPPPVSESPTPAYKAEGQESGSKKKNRKKNKKGPGAASTQTTDETKVEDTEKPVEPEIKLIDIPIVQAPSQPKTGQKPKGKGQGKKDDKKGVDVIPKVHPLVAENLQIFSEQGRKKDEKQQQRGRTLPTEKSDRCQSFLTTGGGEKDRSRSRSRDVAKISVRGDIIPLADWEMFEQKQDKQKQGQKGGKGEKDDKKTGENKKKKTEESTKEIKTAPLKQETQPLTEAKIKLSSPETKDPAAQALKKSDGDSGKNKEPKETIRDSGVKVETAKPPQKSEPKGSKKEGKKQSPETSAKKPDEKPSKDVQDKQEPQVEVKQEKVVEQTEKIPKKDEKPIEQPSKVEELKPKPVEQKVVSATKEEIKDKNQKGQKVEKEKKKEAPKESPKLPKEQKGGKDVSTEAIKTVSKPEEVEIKIEAQSTEKVAPLQGVPKPLTAESAVEKKVQVQSSPEQGASVPPVDVKVEKEEVKPTVSSPPTLEAEQEQKTTEVKAEPSKETVPVKSAKDEKRIQNQQTGKGKQKEIAKGEAGDAKQTGAQKKSADKSQTDVTVSTEATAPADVVKPTIDSPGVITKVNIQEASPVIVDQSQPATQEPKQAAVTEHQLEKSASASTEKVKPEVAKKPTPPPKPKNEKQSQKLEQNKKKDVPAKGVELSKEVKEQTLVVENVTVSTPLSTPVVQQEIKVETSSVSPAEVKKETKVGQINETTTKPTLAETPTSSSTEIEKKDEVKPEIPSKSKADEKIKAQSTSPEKKVEAPQPTSQEKKVEPLPLNVEAKPKFDSKKQEGKGKAEIPKQKETQEKKVESQKPEQSSQPDTATAVKEKEVKVSLSDITVREAKPLAEQEKPKIPEAENKTKVELKPQQVQQKKPDSPKQEKGKGGKGKPGGKSRTESTSSDKGSAPSTPVGSKELKTTAQEKNTTERVAEITKEQIQVIEKVEETKTASSAETVKTPKDEPADKKVEFVKQSKQDQSTPSETLPAPAADVDTLPDKSPSVQDLVTTIERRLSLTEQDSQKIEETKPVKEISIKKEELVKKEAELKQESGKGKQGKGAKGKKEEPKSPGSKSKEEVEAVVSKQTAKTAEKGKQGTSVDKTGGGDQKQDQSANLKKEEPTKKDDVPVKATDSKTTDIVPEGTTEVAKSTPALPAIDTKISEERKSESEAVSTPKTPETPTKSGAKLQGPQQGPKKDNKKQQKGPQKQQQGKNTVPEIKSELKDKSVKLQEEEISKSLEEPATNVEEKKDSKFQTQASKPTTDVKAQEHAKGDEPSKLLPIQLSSEPAGAAESPIRLEPEKKITVPDSKPHSDPDKSSVKDFVDVLTPMANVELCIKPIEPKVEQKPEATATPAKKFDLKIDESTCDLWMSALDEPMMFSDDEDFAPIPEEIKKKEEISSKPKNVDSKLHPDLKPNTTESEKSKQETVPLKADSFKVQGEVEAIKLKPEEPEPAKQEPKHQDKSKQDPRSKQEKYKPKPEDSKPQLKESKSKQETRQKQGESKSKQEIPKQKEEMEVLQPKEIEPKPIEPKFEEPKPALAEVTSKPEEPKAAQEKPKPKLEEEKPKSQESKHQPVLEEPKSKDESKSKQDESKAKKAEPKQKEEKPKQKPEDPKPELKPDKPKSKKGKQMEKSQELKPAEEELKPKLEEPLPQQPKSKPQESKREEPKPTQEKPKPKPDELKPTPVEPKPKQEELKPTPVEPKSIQELKPTPVESMPKQEEFKPTPVEPKPKQEELKPTPVEPKAKQEELKPTPEEPKPKQEEFKPTPVEPKPKQEELKPTPVQPKPDQEESKPTPVEPKPKQSKQGKGKQEESRPTKVESKPEQEELKPTPVEPKPKQEESKLKQEEPRSQPDGSKPKQEEPKPKEEQSKPKQQEPKPRPAGPKPKQEESKSKPDGFKPRQEDSKPKADQLKPKLEQSKPKPVEPKLVEQKTKPEATTVRPAQEQGKHKKEEPKPEESTTKTDESRIDQPKQPKQPDAKAEEPKSIREEPKVKPEEPKPELEEAKLKLEEQKAIPETTKVKPQQEKSKDEGPKPREQTKPKQEPQKSKKESPKTKQETVKSGSDDSQKTTEPLQETLQPKVDESKPASHESGLRQAEIVMKQAMVIQDQPSLPATPDTEQSAEEQFPPIKRRDTKKKLGGGKQKGTEDKKPVETAIAPPVETPVVPEVKTTEASKSEDTAIFGSVKERHRGPRKIIDVTPSEKKVMENIPKSPVTEKTKIVKSDTVIEVVEGMVESSRPTPLASEEFRPEISIFRDAEKAWQEVQAIKGQIEPAVESKEADLADEVDKIMSKLSENVLSWGGLMEAGKELDNTVKNLEVKVEALPPGRTEPVIVPAVAVVDDLTGGAEIEVQVAAARSRSKSKKKEKEEPNQAVSSLTVLQPERQKSRSRSRGDVPKVSVRGDIVPLEEIKKLEEKEAMKLEQKARKSQKQESKAVKSTTDVTAPTSAMVEQVQEIPQVAAKKIETKPETTVKGESSSTQEATDIKETPKIGIAAEKEKKAPVVQKQKDDKQGKDKSNQKKEQQKTPQPLKQVEEKAKTDEKVEVKAPPQPSTEKKEKTAEKIVAKLAPQLASKPAEEKVETEQKPVQQPPIEKVEVKTTPQSPVSKSTEEKIKTEEKIEIKPAPQTLLSKPEEEKKMTEEKAPLPPPVPRPAEEKAKKDEKIEIKPSEVKKDVVKLNEEPKPGSIPEKGPKTEKNIKQEEKQKEVLTPTLISQETKLQPVPVPSPESTSQSSPNLPFDLSHDSGFWTDKWQYIDAETNLRLSLIKKGPKDEKEVKDVKKDKPDRGGDGGGGSGKPPQPRHDQPKSGKGGQKSSEIQSENVSSPLPGGIAGWSAESTLLSTTTTTTVTTERVEQVDDVCQEQVVEDEKERNKLINIAKDDLNELVVDVRDVETRLLELSAADLSAMSAALEAIIADLAAKESVSQKLESVINSLPPDEDSESLSTDYQQLKDKLTSLLDQARQGREGVQDAEIKLARQQAELDKYNKLLTGLEDWLSRAKNVLLTDVEENNVGLIQEQIRSHENLKNELKQYSGQLSELTGQITALQQVPELSTLCPVFEPRIARLRQSFADIEESLIERLRTLEGLKLVEDGAVATNPPDSLTLHATLSQQTTNVCSTDRGVTLPTSSTTTEEPSQPQPSPPLVCSVVDVALSPSTLLLTALPKPSYNPSLQQAGAEEQQLVQEIESILDKQDQSDRVIEYLEVGEGGSLSWKDDTIGSSASPIPTEEVLDLDSPKFEYYEEIKYKSPIVVTERTSHTDEGIVEETTRRQQEITTIVKEVQISPEEVAEQRLPTDTGTMLIETTTKKIVKKVTKNISVVDGVETVTEETVIGPETVEETKREIQVASEPETKNGSSNSDKTGLVKLQSVEDSTTTYDDSLNTKGKVLERKPSEEFSLETTLAESTDVPMPTDSSSETTKPTKFEMSEIEDEVEVLPTVDRLSEPSTLPDESNIHDKPVLESEGYISSVDIVKSAVQVYSEMTPDSLSLSSASSGRTVESGYQAELVSSPDIVDKKTKHHKRKKRKKNDVDKGYEGQVFSTRGEVEDIPAAKEVLGVAEIMEKEQTWQVEQPQQRSQQPQQQSKQQQIQQQQHQPQQLPSQQQQQQNQPQQQQQIKQQHQPQQPPPPQQQQQKQPQQQQKQQQIQEEHLPGADVLNVVPVRESIPKIEVETKVTPVTETAPVVSLTIESSQSLRKQAPIEMVSVKPVETGEPRPVVDKEVVENYEVASLEPETASPQEQEKDDVVVVPSDTNLGPSSPRVEQICEDTPKHDLNVELGAQSPVTDKDTLVDGVKINVVLDNVVEKTVDDVDKCLERTQLVEDDVVLLQKQEDVLSKPEMVDTYMQTQTPTPPPQTQDLSVQTSSQEHTPRVETESQTNRVVGTEEEQVQTSPAEPVLTQELQVQTDVAEAADQSQQTSKQVTPTASSQQLLPGTDETSQTVAPVTVETEMQTKDIPITDQTSQTVQNLSDTSSQTKSPEKILGKDESSQTRKSLGETEITQPQVKVQEAEERSESTSSEELLEVRVATKLSVEPSTTREALQVSSQVSVNDEVVLVDTGITPRDADKKYSAEVTVDVPSRQTIEVKSHISTEDSPGTQMKVEISPKSKDQKKKGKKNKQLEVATKISMGGDVSETSPPFIGDHSPGPPPLGGEEEPNIPETITIPEEVKGQWKQVTSLLSDRIINLKNVRGMNTSSTIQIASLEALNKVDESPEETNKNVESIVKELENAIETNDRLAIQKSVISYVENVSDWLESIEYRVLVSQANTREPSEDRMKKIEGLLREVGTVENKLMQTNYILCDNGVFEEEGGRVIKECLDSLGVQVREVVEVTEKVSDDVSKDMNGWEEFLNGVNNVSVLVEELRQELDNVIESDSSTRGKLEELERIENTNRCHMLKTGRLITSARYLTKQFPTYDIPADAYAVHDLTRAIESNIIQERERLLQLLSLADEYEQTLKEFAQIIEVADNLVDGPIKISGLQDLHDEMQKHRKFFVNLSHCKGILESLEGNLADETRSQHSELHQRLHSRASGILDKAAARAQLMAMAASKWNVLEQGVKEEQQWLQVAQQRPPDLHQVTSSDYDKYISIYQSLSSDVAVHHARIMQLTDVANKLQEVISCSDLECFYDDYLGVILKLQEEVNSNLQRLLAFQETWCVYELLADKLEAWLKTTESELTHITPITARGNMRQFWELKAQLEVHNHVRSEAGNNFENAMMILPVADEVLQRQFLAQLQERWKLTEGKMNEMQRSVAVNLSAEDTPVNEKLKLLEDELNELNDTVDDLHGIIKNDEELNLYVERLQVLSNRLETIQEELGRLGLLPAAESEKVGCLLGLARRLEQLLADELDGSVLLREKLQSLQKGMQRVRRNQNRMSSTLDQCETGVNLGVDLVEQAVATGQQVHDELITQWQELMSLRQVLHTLPMRLRLSVSPVRVEREITYLQENHAVLESRCSHLLGLLRSRLALWRRFEKQLDLVHQNVQEADYMMELLKIQGSVDYERLLRATERLEGLHDTMDQREDLVLDLKTSAEPLVNTCSADVGVQINSAVEEAVTAWNETCNNLNDLCNKYQDAVKLWSRYKDASDVMKKWVEQQMCGTDELMMSPEDTLARTRMCEETLAAHKSRLAELRTLVGQIAADIGLEAGGLLEGEVEALGQRLEDVREALTTLTTAAEEKNQGRESCRNDLAKTKLFLHSVRQTLDVVDDSCSEDTLSKLRSHLLALGKTESQVNGIKEKTTDMKDNSSETSVVEILELWQQVFKETFQQYHRLSARLVRSQDGAAALHLWQEYLLHVQQFLSETLPHDYNSLCETQRLCEVHQNLLTSQHAVLLSKKESSTQEFSLSVQEQFNTLANLHNETLTRIMDRHSEVDQRITLWDIYRRDQSRLLSWLRDMEREKSRLQLRYIHVRRVGRLLEQIKQLLTKIPAGTSQCDNLTEQQTTLLHFYDEALSTSVRMEHAAIQQRITNLQAGLETWKDFLERIIELEKCYERETGEVEKVLKEATVKLSQPIPVYFPAIETRLESYKDLKMKVSGLVKRLDDLVVTQEQLKECLSPHDVKSITQRVWLLSQQQADVEHQLVLQIHCLEDKLALQQVYSTRQAKFINWAHALTDRYQKTMESSLRDPELELSNLESEINSELSVKSRDYDWLTSTGEKLLTATSPGDRVDSELLREEIERKTKEVVEAWEAMKQLAKGRIKQRDKLKSMIEGLLARISDIRTWLQGVEQELEAPVLLEKSSKKAVDRLLKEHETLQKGVEKQSANVAEVLNLCDMLLSDVKLSSSGLDVAALAAAYQGLEKRWKNVCVSSSEKKRRIMCVWDLLQQLAKLCKEQEPWLIEREQKLADLQTRSLQPRLNEIPQLLNQLDEEKKEVETRQAAKKILEASYSKLAQDSRLSSENLRALAGPARNFLGRWHSLEPTRADVVNSLTTLAKLRDEFIRQHKTAVVGLTDVLARITQVELLQNVGDKLRRLDELETILDEQGSCLNKADQLALDLMKSCSQEEDIAATQDMVDEYQTLWKELKQRFQDARNKCLVESKEIQVSTLRFEQDCEVQVDTLRRLTSRDAYGMELDAAILELNQHLYGLENLLETPPPGEDNIIGTTTHSALSKIISTCTSSLELVQHLSQTLTEGCGMNEIEARCAEVREQTARYQDVVARARERERQLRDASERGRLTCPLCSHRNWQQLDNDLWRLEQWIHFAEATQSNRSPPPSSIETLEDVIQDHRELLLDLDSHKSIVVSLNIVGQHLADHAEDVEKARLLRDRLAGLNRRWDLICSEAGRWQRILQEALMQNEEFHETIGELVCWLDTTEQTIRQAEPIDLTQDEVVMMMQYRRFKELGNELERCEPRVMSLQEAAVQLLEQGGPARERLNGLRMKLVGLRRLVKVYVLQLGAALGRDADSPVDQRTVHQMLERVENNIEPDSSATSLHTTSGDDVDTTVLRRGFRFLGRVIRASLPIQALMLLLIGAASIVNEDDYSCVLSNQARLQPYYPNGPPPV